VIDAVVKVGGGILAIQGALDGVARAVELLAGRTRLLVVPGGGPFADAVRAADRAHALGADAAHWMAVLAMNQYAYLLAERMRGARVVECVDDGDGVPILAPYRWLRDADPLPHSWDVTSDSIAAWIAGAVGARRLILVKPARAPLASLTDRYFPRALPAGVSVSVRTPGELGGAWLA
jgi:5-(aminomethyl)-3-furanmethanol phosphate kinase